MTHEMKLNPKHFNYFLKGTKNLELRLFDEKRSKIKVGDVIIFKKLPDLNESLEVIVKDLFKYNSFNELIKCFSISEIADDLSTKEEVLEDLNKYYPKEKQAKYGVVGIKVKLNNIKTLN